MARDCEGVVLSRDAGGLEWTLHSRKEANGAAYEVDGGVALEKEGVRIAGACDEVGSTQTWTDARRQAR